MMVTAETVSGPAALLVRVTVCETELPRVIAPKLTDVGVTVGAVGPVMVTVAALEVAEAKLVSPVKLAVMAFDPSGRVVRLRTAVPLARVAVPRVVLPLVKVTVLPLVVRLPEL